MASSLSMSCLRWVPLRPFWSSHPSPSRSAERLAVPALKGFNGIVSGEPGGSVLVLPTGWKLACRWRTTIAVRTKPTLLITARSGNSES
eukprot:scaffold304286_cov30-Tisochrysis_lutea.AAC.2